MKSIASRKARAGRTIAHPPLPRCFMAEQAITTDTYKLFPSPRNRHRALFDTVLNAVLLANDDGRYVDANPAALAQLGLQAMQHNTLAASDYGLIDRDTMTPRPNYWAAVLWRRTMGTTVLASPRSPSPALRLYAQCTPAQHGGVTVMALNTGEATQRLSLGGSGRAWVMTGKPVDTRSITINGKAPGIGTDGALTGLEGVAAKGAVTVPGQSVAFYTVPGANNPACR